MKNKKYAKVILVFLIILFINYFYCNFFTSNMLVGDYYNINYENSPAVETSKNSDILSLKGNNTFYSNYYGEGSYKINYSILGTTIKLYYNSGSAVIKKTVKRNWFGKPKIIMFEDINHYYKKK